VRALSSVRLPAKDAFALLKPLADEPTFRVRNEILRFFRDCPEPLTPEQSAWLHRWKTTPDPKHTMKGWDRDYLAPGGTYESAFQNLLLQMVDEKGRPVPPAPVSGRWMGSVGKNPPKPAAEKARIQERIQRLAKVVDGAATADLGAGRAMFEKTCAVCHSVGKDGNGFAPSLAGSKNRMTEAVLTSVLDPSQAVESVFRVYHIETTDGETYDGFFGEETDDALTVRFAGGTRQAVPLKRIKSAGYIDGSSVMPDGLGEAFTDAQMVDLVKYVQSIR
jgi:putative heme-binding domain-containing protein